MMKRLILTLLVTISFMGSGILFTPHVAGLMEFPTEFTSQIIYQSQTSLTGAMGICDLNGDGVRELIFADWSGYLYMKEPGEEGARRVFREMPDEEGNNPIMGIEKPGREFVEDNQILIYGYSGNVSILTFGEDLSVENVTTIYRWGSEIFSMAVGDMLKNNSGEELYFGDWKTPHIIVLWKEGDSWRNCTIHTPAPVKSLTFLDFDPAVPGEELYATLDNPQNSTLVEMYRNESGGWVAETLLQDRYLLSNVKVANILSNDDGEELIVTGLSGKAYILMRVDGELQTVLLYDTKGGGGLEGLSTGALNLSGPVNVSVMTGYSNIVTLSLEMSGRLETRIIWSSPNIKEFELAGVFIGDFDPTLDGEEIYVAAYSGYIAEIYYARGRVSVVILDLLGEETNTLFGYSAFTVNYTLSLRTYNQGRLSIKIFGEMEGITTSPSQYDINLSSTGVLELPLSLIVSSSVPPGNYTLYIFLNFSGSMYTYRYPVRVIKAHLENLTLSTGRTDMYLFVEGKREGELSLTYTLTPSYRYLRPHVEVSCSPIFNVSYTVDYERIDLQVSIGEPVVAAGEIHVVCSVPGLNATSVIHVHVISLRESLTIRSSGLKEGRRYFTLNVSAEGVSTPVHLEISVYRGEREIQRVKDVGVWERGSEIIVPLDTPLKDGERVTVKIQTGEGVVVKEESFRVGGEEGFPWGFAAITVISLLTFALLILYVSKLRREALLEE